MEKEQKQTEDLSENTSELSLDNIADRIAEELGKVVGIDQELLGQHVEFLGNIKVKEVEKQLRKKVKGAKLKGAVQLEPGAEGKASP